MKKIETKQELTTYLHEKYVCYTSNSHYLYMLNDLLIVQSKQYRAKLMVDEYLQLFPDQDFYLIEDKPEDINEQKDIEYYRFKNK